MVHVIHEIQTRSRWLFLALKFTFLPQSSLQWKMKKLSSQIWRAVRNVNWLMKMYITLDLQRVFCKSRGSYAGLTTQLRLSDLSHTKSLFILLYRKYIQTWLCLEIQKKKKSSLRVFGKLVVVWQLSIVSAWAEHTSSPSFLLQASALYICIPMCFACLPSEQQSQSQTFPLAVPPSPSELSLLQPLQPRNQGPQIEAMRMRSRM